MSSMGNDDKTTYMNNRIPRKKTASSLNSGSKSTAGVQSDSSFSAAKNPVTSDILALQIPRKSKDGELPTNKKRTHDMSSIATTKKTPKKVKPNNNDTTSGRDFNNIPSPVNNAPTYQMVKEGRVSGYPIIVSQVGSEHDAILLGCKATDNPQEYLDNNKDGKVKIRWKFAGYNGLVPTHTVRLKLVDGAPPIRKAAVLSGLLETGDELIANKAEGIDQGEEEDDDAPIIKAIRSNLLDSTVRSDKDGDYNDQEDRDEKLVCYERSASVGYTGQSGVVSAAAADNHNNISSSTNQVVGEGSEEASSSANQNSENVESSFTDFDPQVNDDADTNSQESKNESTPPVVTSRPSIKSENGDVDSVATDPMDNQVVSIEVRSDINVKTEEEDTDDDEIKPSAVASDINVKLEDTDDEMSVQEVTSSSDVKKEIDSVYGDDTDNDEPKPLEVMSEANLKTEEVDTDDEMDAQQVEPVITSSNDVKKEKDSAYGDDTDNDEPMPLEVKSDVNVKAEEEDTDDKMNTVPLSEDNPTISAPTSESEEDNAVVLEFFQKLNRFKEYQWTLDRIKETIKANPHLLNAKCPHEIGDIREGFTAMEAICCHQMGADTRDLLYELVRLGGKATDKCYEGIMSQAEYDTPLEHLTVLVLSGYYPMKGHHLFLDQLADGFEEEIDNNGEELHVEILSILYKTVKVGDNLTCGDIDSTIISNINQQLPSLKV